MGDEPANTWKPLDLVKVTAEYLAGKGVPSPRLDAELLLCRAMNIARRVELYAGFERTVAPEELAKYRAMVRRRAGREPVSRILGEREFMGIRFLVTPDVLSPRPETELLVEAALARVAPAKNVPAETASEPEPEKFDAALERMLDAYAEDVDSDEHPESETPGAAQPADSPRAAPAGGGRADRRAQSAAGKQLTGPERAIRALDLGTGSGCIAIALAAGLPDARVTAIDISPKALVVARRNAETAGVADRIDFREGDWFSACRDDERYDLILANPPYLVPGDPDIWPEVEAYDPPVALYGGDDGLDDYRKLAPGIRGWLRPGGVAFFEVGAGQAQAALKMFEEHGLSNVRVHRDYGGVERAVSGERSS